MDAAASKKMTVDMLLGVCVKDAQGVVLSQNEICIKICGDQLGKHCRNGCMKNYTIPSETDDLVETMSTVHNVNESAGPCDAVLINTGEHIVTLLHSKAEQVQKEIAMFEKLGLTKVEQAIALLLLDGLTNKQIAEKRFTSDSTIKTHINNLYKKLPPNLRIRISKLRKNKA